VVRVLVYAAWHVDFDMLRAAYDAGPAGVGGHLHLARDFMGMLRSLQSIIATCEMLVFDFLN
jgi:hypothetical protein